MSDRMEPISFKKLLNWAITEYNNEHSIFGIPSEKFYHKKSDCCIPFADEKLGMPIGPAAGPNSQLAQNIISAYLTGSRFIELKTVQVLDGEDLPVAKPCINAEDECYNVEWSTELTVGDAYREYVKAWFMLNFLGKELGLSDGKDFVFNMSVGYDLEGIKSPKIDSYIENLKSAGNAEIWKECYDELKENLGRFKNFNQDDLDSISDRICSSITLSTLHGCPPDEIERIAKYLLEVKKLNTFIKMNPTLLGEKFVRNMFDSMGYGYITLNPKHFEKDLQYDDGVEMLKRLKKVAEKEKIMLGVKLSNTLPVKIENGELPGEEMYMSGRSLYPLTINLARKLAKEFDGDLIISYSGGADFFNIKDIFETGICPITFATTILKPGGYMKIKQLAEEVEPLLSRKKSKIDCETLAKLADAAEENCHYEKSFRKVKSRKINEKLPMFSCSVSPCNEECPIHQRIPDYIAEAGKGDYETAFMTIAVDNALPSITGTICNHKCQTKCTRIDYEGSVAIRDIKKKAALAAEDSFAKEVVLPALMSDKKVAVIGAGPAGISTAMYLRRNGIDAVVFEKESEPYGVVRHIIPDFRISKEDIERDLRLFEAYGIEVKYNCSPEVDIKALKKNYDYVVLAVGAPLEVQLKLEDGSCGAVNALDFLRSFKEDKSSITPGENVAVVGGGNVAMDAARAAKRVNGVKKVSIIYRRTRDLMPAESDEIDEAVAEGIEINTLLAPLSFKDGVLKCQKMVLGEADASGRRKPVPTDETVEIKCDTVIAAIGEKADSGLYKTLGLDVTEKGLPKVNGSYETSIDGVYAAGDAVLGASSIVKAMATGKAIAKDILSRENLKCDFDRPSSCGTELKLLKDNGVLQDRKGLIKEDKDCDAARCLGCEEICELCVDVCPNRANKMIEVGGKHEILHIDAMCNECGNCGIFCTHDGNPYKDKFTLFTSYEKLMDSSNAGFTVEDLETGKCTVRCGDGSIKEYSFNNKDGVSDEEAAMIDSVIKNYKYLLKQYEITPAVH